MSTEEHPLQAIPESSTVQHNSIPSRQLSNDSEVIHLNIDLAQQEEEMKEMEEMEPTWKKVATDSAIFATLFGCWFCSIPALIMACVKPAKDKPVQDRIDRYRTSCCLSFFAVFVFLLFFGTAAALQYHYQIFWD